jgi:hypothetical protein
MVASTKRNKKKAAKKTEKNAKKRVKHSVSGSMKYDNIDVKTIEDVAKLIEHIKNNIVTLVLIYADWCGHCGTFKDSIWKKLAAMKNRKVAMAQVNEKVMEHLKNHIPNLNIDGYPTNILVGNDLKAATLVDKETGQTTNALPNTRDMASMTKLVTASPSEVVANNNMNESEPEAEPEETQSVSATPTHSATVNRRNSGKNFVENLNNSKSTILSGESNPVPNPPEVEEDIMSTQSANNSMENNTMTETASQPKVGGSLFSALLDAAGEIAVPVALTGAAIASTRSRPARKRGGTAKKLRGKSLK